MANFTDVTYLRYFGKHTSHAIAEAIVHLFLHYLRSHPQAHSTLSTFFRMWDSCMLVFCYNVRLAFHAGNIGWIRATDVAV